jgi:hypothetical protein
MHSLAFTVHRSPFTVHRSPFIVHRSLLAVRCFGAAKRLAWLLLNRQKGGSLTTDAH